MLFCFAHVFAKYAYNFYLKILIFCLLILMCYNKIDIKTEPSDTHCSILPNTSLLLVNTLDGIIYAIDLNNGGKVLWKYNLDSPLLSSSLGRAEAIRNGVKIQVIPSLDGQLYQYDEEMVEALPFTASNLLKNSLHFSDDIVLVGGEYVSTYSLDLKTGKPYYHCGADGCQYFEDNLSANEPLRESTTCPLISGSLLIKRINRMVKSVDSRFGNERWNFSVGDVELKYLKPAKEYQDRGHKEPGRLMEDQDDNEEDIVEELNPSYLNQFGITVHVPEGVVTGFSDEQKAETSDDLRQIVNYTFDRANEWHQSFTCPIAKVWSYIDGEIQPLDLNGGQYVGALKALNSNMNHPYGLPIYIGTYKGQLYVQAPNVPYTTVSVPPPKWNSGNYKNYEDDDGLETELANYPLSFPRTYWKPYLATSLTRTPDRKGLMGLDGENEFVREDENTDADLSNGDVENLKCEGQLVKAESHALTTFRQYMDFPFDTGFYLWPQHSHSTPQDLQPPFVEEETPSLPTKSTLRTHNSSKREGYCPARPSAMPFSSIRPTAPGMCPSGRHPSPPENYHMTAAPYFLYTLGGASSFWFWWKEILLISLILTAIIHVLLLNLSTRFRSPLFPWQRAVGHFGADAILERSYAEECRRYASFVDRLTPRLAAILSLSAVRVVLQWIITHLILGQILVITRPSLTSSSTMTSTGSNTPKEECNGAPPWHNSSGYASQNALEINSNLPGTVLTKGTDLERVRSDSGSVPNSPGSESLAGPDVFVSRFLTDFEPMRSLGRGGFGLVIQVRNRMDDQFYAIKRITLPNREESKQKVLREVRALAKLDHTNIVRYYQAWLECPPPLWDDRFSLGKRHEISKRLGNYHCLTPSQLSDGHVTHQLISSTSDRGDTSSRPGSLVPRQRTTSSLLDYVVTSPMTSSPRPPQDFVDEGDDDDGGVIFLAPSGRASSDHVHSHVEGKGKRTGKDERNRLHAGNRSKLYLYIQMQLCKSETLKDWLNSVVIVDDESKDATSLASSTKSDAIFLTVQQRHAKAIKIFSQILEAVHYFHDRGLIHRDLKPSNIFFSMEEVVKIGDFGLATASVVVNSSNTSENSNSGSSPSDQSPTSSNDSSNHKAAKGGEKNHLHQHTLQVGTRLYMSPEQIQNKTYTNKIDMFSLGLILFELLHSFGTQMERVKTLNQCRQRILPDEFCNFYPEESYVVKWLLSENPNDRPDANQLKANDSYKAILAKMAPVTT